jgi:hypothetical protein
MLEKLYFDGDIDLCVASGTTGIVCPACSSGLLEMVQDDTGHKFAKCNCAPCSKAFVYDDVLEVIKKELDEITEYIA